MRMTAFLARWRVPLGFACGVVAIVFARPSRASLLAGAPIALAGEALRIWAAGHLEKGREVTSSGPYRWTRHPLYIGSALLGAGLAVAANHVVVAAVAAAYVALALPAAARAEERHLSARFGDAYERYRTGASAEVSRRFSLARARRNREHRTLAGVALVLAYLAAIHT
ncbi:MAG TPA: methyltransferase [Vicinamibacterales bacterium]|nr:methyltransferase [Vicinamibacterales bacterium]